MSDEMAVKEVGDSSESRMNGEPTPETALGVADGPPGTDGVNEANSTPQPSDDTTSEPDSSAAESVSGTADVPGVSETSDNAPAPIKVNDFKGFEQTEVDNSILNYRRVLERMEEELAYDLASLRPLRHVSAAPASRRVARDRETEGSRPSSALSVRSDVSALGSDAVSAPSSPAGGGGRRRATAEWGSASLRAPLEQGWRRELVYRATLDHHSRRNADIYYYTPAGKKLRSTREIAENLSGTGFTLENFSFFKEPLGLDDPEKEIIRDAKVIRRLDSPQSPALAAAVAPVEGKRIPKPKAPKGASPPPASLPAAVVASDKIKVKSVGSRLSRSGSGSSPAAAPRADKRPAASDNNNTTPWKKARALGPPPALQSRPPERLHRLQQDDATTRQEPWCGGPGGAGAAGGRRPCSMTCAGAAGAVPSLACAACLCLYHPHCQGLPHNYSLPPTRDFLCKNCGGGVPGTPSLSPPPLVHKSGAGAPPPPPLSLPREQQARRVLLRMKQVSEGGGSGERVWAVTRGPRPNQRVAPAPAPPPMAIAPAPPVQSVALLNGRRFIVVQRSVAAPIPAPPRAS